MTYEVSLMIQKNAALSGAAYSIAEVTAMNYLVGDLKNNALWAGMTALYPFCGSTAVPQSLNLANPGSTTYQLTWGVDSTGLHASTGYTPSGAGNPYASPGLAPSFFGRSSAIGIYCRTNSATNNTDVAAGSSSATSRLVMLLKYSNGTAYMDAYNASTERISATNSDSRGFYCLNINGANHQLYRNGTSLASTTTAATTATIPTANYNIGYDGVGGTASTGREYALILFSSAIATTSQAALYTLIQSFQSILSRNI